MGQSPKLTTTVDPATGLLMKSRIVTSKQALPSEESVIAGGQVEWLGSGIAAVAGPVMTIRHIRMEATYAR
jgi:hypothetical protein